MGTLLLLAVAWLAQTIVAPGAATEVRVGEPLVTPPVSGANPIAAARRIDWSLAGVTGGVPSVTTPCATFGTAGQGRSFVQSVTAGQISAAIQSCDVGGGPIEYVLLRTGTYNLTDGIDFGGDSRVVLRGEGPDSTLLNFTNVTPCLGQHAAICIRSVGLTYYGPGPPQNSATWAGGYAKGTTTIQLDPLSGAATLPNLTAGMFIHVDQLNDNGATSDVTVCDGIYNGTTGCTQQGGTGNSRNNRVQNQRVQVVSIESGSCGNSGNGTCDVVISPGLYMPNYRAGQSPGAWWGANFDLASHTGIENLSINTTGLGGAFFRHSISIVFAREAWVKNVRMVNCPTPKTCVNLFGVSHVTVRDSYLYGNLNAAVGSTTYGIETFGATDALVENNICHGRASCFVGDGDQGTVVAYNYFFDAFYQPSSCGTPCIFMQSSNYSHNAGNSMVLHEGNEGVGGKADIIHGSSNLLTYFRNRFSGWERNKANETNAFTLYAYNRYYNAVCNVLGTASYHTLYDAGAHLAVYKIGQGYGGATGPNIPPDPLTGSTLFRWGNWNTLTSTNDTGTNDQTGTVWNTNEVPSGIGVLPNAVPTAQTCGVNSMYLSAKPSWWGSTAWPAIGPDVTGGNVPSTGGHVMKNPAHTCWDSLVDDTAFAADYNGYRPKRFAGCPYQ